MAIIVAYIIRRELAAVELQNKQPSFHSKIRKTRIIQIIRRKIYNFFNYKTLA